MSRYQSSIPDWETKELTIKALQEELKQQQEKLNKMYYIDEDLKSLIVSILNNAIKAEKGTLSYIHLKTYALEVSQSFNAELLFSMVMIAQGLSLDQIIHCISMQSDVPD